MNNNGKKLNKLNLTNFRRKYIILDIKDLFSPHLSPEMTKAYMRLRENSDDTLAIEDANE